MAFNKFKNLCRIYNLSASVEGAGDSMEVTLSSNSFEKGVATYFETKSVLKILENQGFIDNINQPENGFVLRKDANYQFADGVYLNGVQYNPNIVLRISKDHLVRIEENLDFDFQV